MSFFSSIKDNLTHGGVEVRVEAPGSASMQHGTIPVTVYVTAGSKSATIKGVRAELVAEPTRIVTNQQAPASPAVPQVLAAVENGESFILNSGEEHTVQLELVMNWGSALSQVLPEGSGLSGVAKTLQAIQSTAEALDQSTDKKYLIRATADVEGIALDPSDRAYLVLNKPGQISGVVTKL